ncbi:unnamed protein product [Rotaria sp. Silwood2]|nr:unnamed protein product [Rotaria sp. Silwood2]CAF4452328.1 unnamed protein product [Rotaria sp. Silwood2]CAF4668332.1 unnamed protein product [Rotaria sp. Silwood2]
MVTFGPVSGSDKQNFFEKLRVCGRGGALELALAFINTNTNALSISIKINPNALALLALELINALVLALN